MAGSISEWTNVVSMSAAIWIVLAIGMGFYGVLSKAGA